MVAAGLAERVSVSQYRLAFHLTLACVIFAAIVWTAQGLAPRAPIAAPTRVRAGALTVLALVIVQIYLGALVSGLRAGLIYNTWPLIDGSLVPEGARLLFYSPLWRNVFENTLTVQFDHRMAAYALALLAVLHAADVARTLRGGAALTGALALASAVTLQAALGIAALLHQAPLSLALLHQAGALVVLAIAVVHAERFERQPAHAGAAKSGTAMRHGEQAT
jgi:cytochrome c oxidase assembly protein subunit 15